MRKPVCTVELLDEYTPSANPASGPAQAGCSAHSGMIDGMAALAWALHALLAERERAAHHRRTKQY
jgi:hypothetical protein